MTPTWRKPEQAWFGQGEKLLENVSRENFPRSLPFSPGQRSQSRKVPEQREFIPKIKWPLIKEKIYRKTI